MRFKAQNYVTSVQVVKHGCNRELGLTRNLRPARSRCEAAAVRRRARQATAGPRPGLPLRRAAEPEPPALPLSVHDLSY